ncbi:MAG: MOSC domain-containing protein [Acidimicrobiia bacterium]
MTVGTVASIHRFPVKSMQGESLPEVEVVADGMVGDRTWALRDIETGKLASAKRPRPWAALLDCRATGAGDDVVISLPTGEDFHVRDPGLPVALEAVLGRTVALEASERAQQGTFDSEWPEIEGVDLAGDLELPTNLTGEGTSFIDLGILHVLTTTSLASLAEADPELDLDIRRFRPSLVLETPGLAGFPENDDWAGATVRFGTGADGVEIEIGAPTPRCIMPTVAQGDLPRQIGILQTLARINRRSSDLGSFACLGAYATVARPGVVRAGDEITVL